MTRAEEDVEDAKASKARGGGRRGGNPADADGRPCHYIRLLKHEFGRRFHTHLYTMSTDADKIRMLAAAGLDEIRFHVPPGLWSRAGGSALVAASRHPRPPGPILGVEEPPIPGREAGPDRI